MEEKSESLIFRSELLPNGRYTALIFFNITFILPNFRNERFKNINCIKKVLILLIEGSEK